MKRSRSTTRIATVYRSDNYDLFEPRDMSTIRWLRISEALARLGFCVDMIVNTRDGLVQKSPNLRFVPYSQFDWQQYDIIKTLFHRGFESLRGCGGHEHPFIISKLGSVVGRRDDTEGVFFFGSEHAELYETQKHIRQHSAYVTVLTEQSRQLWAPAMNCRESGDRDNTLLVPTGVDAEIPEPQHNPFRGIDGKIAIYLGNIYDGKQRETNLLWQSRLNKLGRLLKKRGITLCFVGPGRTDHLDHDAVCYLGTVCNDRLWDYQYFADVGIAFAQGETQHNESSKIYYYLRTGLPVVSESPIPNNWLIAQSNLGRVVDYGDDQVMAEAIESVIHSDWDRERAIHYMLSSHTWDHRACVYDALIAEQFGYEN